MSLNGPPQGNNTGDADYDSVTTEEGDITGETSVKLSLSSNQTNVSSSNWTAVFDTANEDNKSEVNGSTQFVPDKTGDYAISFKVRFSSLNDSDNLQIRLRNVTDDSVPDGGRTFRDTGGGGDGVLSLQTVVELTAGKTYEVQVQNANSSFDIRSSSQDTYGAIKWEPVHT